MKVVDVKPVGSVVAVPASLTTTFSLYAELPYSATPQGARAIILYVPFGSDIDQAPFSLVLALNSQSSRLASTSKATTCALVTVALSPGFLTVPEMVGVPRSNVVTSDSTDTPVAALATAVITPSADLVAVIK